MSDAPAHLPVNDGLPMPDSTPMARTVAGRHHLAPLTGDPSLLYCQTTERVVEWLDWGTLQRRIHAGRTFRICAACLAAAHGATLVEAPA